jgi:hypothetical protein
MLPQEYIDLIVAHDPRWQHDLNMWVNWTNERLINEYKEMMRSQFGLFKHNARVALNLLAAILLQRGVTHIDNLFGPIEIKIQQ